MRPFYLRRSRWRRTARWFGRDEDKTRLGIVIIIGDVSDYSTSRFKLHAVTSNKVNSPGNKGQKESKTCR